MHLCEALEHEFPQLLERLWAFCAPPEPAPTRLVQRPPEHGHVHGAQLLQLDCNRVEVGEELGVLE